MRPGCEQRRHHRQRAEPQLVEARRDSDRAEIASLPHHPHGGQGRDPLAGGPPAGPFPGPSAEPLARSSGRPSGGYFGEYVGGLLAGPSSGYFGGLLAGLLAGRQRQGGQQHGGEDHQCGEGDHGPDGPDGRGDHGSQRGTGDARHAVAGGIQPVRARQIRLRQLAEQAAQAAEQQRGATAGGRQHYGRERGVPPDQPSGGDEQQAVRAESGEVGEAPPPDPVGDRTGQRGSDHVRYQQGRDQQAARARPAGAFQREQQDRHPGTFVGQPRTGGDRQIAGENRPLSVAGKDWMHSKTLPWTAEQASASRLRSPPGTASLTRCENYECRSASGQPSLSPQPQPQPQP
jgi:hypothetical protein